jgi:hypothetical protein
LGNRSIARAGALLAGLTLVAALAGTSVATDDAFDRARWRNNDSNFRLKVGDNVDRKWDPLLRRAADQWSASPVVAMEVGNGSANRRECSPTEREVEVCSSKYGTNGNLGLTILRLDGNDYIQWAIVKLNDTYFDERGGEYNTQKARIHTVCHELGHALGLPHPPNNSRSCLNDSLRRLEETLKPGNQGLAALEDRYDRDRSSRSGLEPAGGEPITSGVAPVDPALIEEAADGLSRGEDENVVPLPDGGALVAVGLKAEEPVDFAPALDGPWVR